MDRADQIDPCVSSQFPKGQSDPGNIDSVFMHAYLLHSISSVRGGVFLESSFIPSCMSSTRIRQTIAQGYPSVDLDPDVADLIKSYSLYQ